MLGSVLSPGGSYTSTTHKATSQRTRNQQEKPPREPVRGMRRRERPGVGQGEVGMVQGVVRRRKVCWEWQGRTAPDVWTGGCFVQREKLKVQRGCAASRILCSAAEVMRKKRLVRFWLERLNFFKFMELYFAINLLPAFEMLSGKESGIVQKNWP